MAARDDILTRTEIDDALAGLPDWRYRLGGLVTAYKTPTAAAALELIAAVGRLAEDSNHHPDLDWRYNRGHRERIERLLWSDILRERRARRD